MIAANAPNIGNRLQWHADTAEEFPALMRAAAQRCGRTAGQIASITGLPRSTVYHFLSENNFSLPKHRHQVQQFFTACRLARPEIETIMLLWDRLSDQQTAMVAPKPVVTSSLRRDVDSFVGRDRTLQRLLDSAASGRTAPILTIDGMAGVGKTALATRAAHALKEQFPDGQFFVQLQAHTPGHRPADPAEVLRSLLIALGLDSRSVPDTLIERRNLWHDRLVNRRLLLVLDDAADHAQVEPLLPGGAACTTLVTSRRRLVALDGAQPFALNPLEQEAAMDLFVTLARREIVDAAEHAAVAEIVQLCGGLPLAIVLLAGRLAHHPAWTFTDVVARFAGGGDQLAELAAGDRAVRTVFARSYENLTPRQQLVFRRAGQHPGPDLDADAVAVLADVEVETARWELETLYNHHLLDETAPGRYRQHGLVRAFARSRAVTEADDGIDQAVIRLIDDYYQRTAASANQYLTTRPSVHPIPGTASAPAFGSEAEALAWMRRERRNLLACLEYVTPQHPALTVELTAALAGLLEWDGPLPLARELHERALTTAIELGDRLGEAAASNDLAVVHRLTGDLDTALDLHQQALKIFRDTGHRSGEAATLDNLGVVHRLAMNLGEALDLNQQAVRMAMELGDRLVAAAALNNLGILHRLNQDFTKAIQHHDKALEVFRELKQDSGEAVALDNLGVLYRLTSSPSYTDLSQTALEIFRSIGHRSGEVKVLNEIGLERLAHGDPAQALRNFNAALALAREVGSPLLEARALKGAARCRVLLSEIPASTALDREAFEIYRKLGISDTEFDRYSTNPQFS